MTYVNMYIIYIIFSIRNYYEKYILQALSYGLSTSNSNVVPTVFGEEEPPGKSQEQCNVTEKKEVDVQTMVQVSHDVYRIVCMKSELKPIVKFYCYMHSAGA